MANKRRVLDCRAFSSARGYLRYAAFIIGVVSARESHDATIGRPYAVKSFARKRRAIAQKMPILLPMA